MDEQVGMTRRRRAARRNMSRDGSFEEEENHNSSRTSASVKAVDTGIKKRSFIPKFRQSGKVESYRVLRDKNSPEVDNSFQLALNSNLDDSDVISGQETKRLSGFLSKRKRTVNKVQDEKSFQNACNSTNSDSDITAYLDKRKVVSAFCKLKKLKLTTQSSEIVNSKRDFTHDLNSFQKGLDSTASEMDSEVANIAELSVSRCTKQGITDEEINNPANLSKAKRNSSQVVNSDADSDISEYLAKRKRESVLTKFKKFKETNVPKKVINSNRDYSKDLNSFQKAMDSIASEMMDSEVENIAELSVSRRIETGVTDEKINNVTTNLIKDKLQVSSSANLKDRSEDKNSFETGVDSNASKMGVSEAVYLTESSASRQVELDVADEELNNCAQNVETNGERVLSSTSEAVETNIVDKGEKEVKETESNQISNIDEAHRNLTVEKNISDNLFSEKSLNDSYKVNQNNSDADKTRSSVMKYSKPFSNESPLKNLSSPGVRSTAHLNSYNQELTSNLLIVKSPQIALSLNQSSPRLSELINRDAVNSVQISPKMSIVSHQIPDDHVSQANASNKTVSDKESHQSSVLNLEEDYDSMDLSSESDGEASGENNTQDENEKDMTEKSHSMNLDASSKISRRSLRITRSDQSSLASVESSIQNKSLMRSARIVQVNENFDSIMNSSIETVSFEKSRQEKTPSRIINNSSKYNSVKSSDESKQSRKLHNSVKSSDESKQSRKLHNSVKSSDEFKQSEKRHSARLVSSSRSLSNLNDASVSDYDKENKSVSELVSDRSIAQNSMEIGESFNNPRQRLPRNQKPTTTKAVSRNKSVSNVIELSELRTGCKRNKFSLTDCELLEKLFTAPVKEKPEKKSSEPRRKSNTKRNNENASLSFKTNETPKLKKPKRWVTESLYNYVIPKLEIKYGIKATRRAEKFIDTLVETITTVTALTNKVQCKKFVEELKVEMARLSLIKNHYDFNIFVLEYLPHSFARKSVLILTTFGEEPFVDRLPSGTTFFTSIL